STATTLILDDPLSAVDAPTGRHLVANAILGPLAKGRTIILVSHAVSLVLPVADYVIVLSGGEVIAQGTASEVAANPAVKDITERTVSKSQLDLFEGSEEGKTDEKKKKKESGVAEDSKATKIVEKEEKAAGDVSWGVYSYYLKAAGGWIYTVAFVASLVLIYLVQFLSDNWVRKWSDHSAEQGGGNGTAAAVGVLGGVGRVGGVDSGFGGGVWGVALMSNPFSAAFGVVSGLGPVRATVVEEHHSAGYYALYYGLFGIAIMTAHNINVIVFEIGSLLAARSIHDKLLKTILGAPLRFFEVTPIGRILNRFSKDVSAVDNDVMRSMAWFCERNFAALSILVVIAYGAPSFLVAIPPILYFFRHFAVRYLKTSRELKRLESVSRSPLYSQFSETLNGVATIRAVLTVEWVRRYGQSERFSTQSQDKLDTNHRAYYLLWASNRWLTIRTDLISASVVFFAGAAIFASGNAINPAWAGLILRYAAQFADAILWVIRSHAEMEMAMNSVERCEEYSSIEQEPLERIEAFKPRESWPEQGQVEVSNLSIRYAPALPLVLKSISFTTLPGEKIGVVGRTGAGKSTLSLAFFRIIPFAGGSITIDGHDIGQMGLHDLRERLTIIPQDPVLFTGTLRSNLDPLGVHEDAELWRVLRSTHVLESLQSGGSSGNLVALGEESVPGGVVDETGSVTGSAGGGNGTELTLDSPVVENGGNFSQGQRQLICMARALLRQSKVIFLDEATASIDAATDARIQTTIREELKDATIFCIAHRLRTIVDYDRVLVLDHGEVIEYGSPADLMENSEIGHFRKMCEDTGEFEELMQIARDSAVANAKRREGGKAYVL
ncbi:hypothetical protein HDU67_000756, partial [Dinochytrium kinnereticum]